MMLYSKMRWYSFKMLEEVENTAEFINYIDISNVILRINIFRFGVYIWYTFNKFNVSMLQIEILKTSLPNALHFERSFALH